MRYKPLEYIDAAREIFPQANPPRKSSAGYDTPRARFVSYRKGARAHEARVDYAGLRVRVALVRDPAFDRHALPVISDATSAAQVFSAVGDDVQEGFYVLLLDATHHAIGVYEAHRGTSASVDVSPADVFRVVLAAGAAAYIVLHNHPSGQAKPSVDDNALTARLQQASKLLGLRLLDHIVLGHAGDYYSYADHNKLKEF